MLFGELKHQDGFVNKVTHILRAIKHNTIQNLIVFCILLAFKKTQILK